MQRLLLTVALLVCAAACGGSTDRSSATTANVTFNKHIAPIVFANCVQCHRPGEPAPFALLTYADVKAHADDIGDETLGRHMPPWLPEKGDVAIAGERRLRPDQIESMEEMVEGTLVLCDCPPEITGRVTVSLDNITEFEELAGKTADAPTATAVSMLD